MKISGFIWSEEVIDKLVWTHQVQVAEIVEMFANALKVERLLRGHRRGEDRYIAAGQSHTGRYLVAFFIRKQAGQALIVTAREMTAKERRRYAKK